MATQARCHRPGTRASNTPTGRISTSPIGLVTRAQRVQAKRQEVERIYAIVRASGIAAPHQAAGWLVDAILDDAGYLI